MTGGSFVVNYPAFRVPLRNVGLKEKHNLSIYEKRRIFGCRGENVTGKGKVKVTPVQALRLCTGRTAHRGSRGIAVPSHDHGTRRG